MLTNGLFLSVKCEGMRVITRWFDYICVCTTRMAEMGSVT